MRSIPITIFFLIIPAILFVLYSCENFLSVPSTKPYPDYTGQVDTVFDIEGNNYKTVGIGSQIWLAQNLKTTKLNNGALIPQVIADTDMTWYEAPAYCYYNNDSLFYKETYGPLYNCRAISTGLLCPIGWHIPSKSDWNTLAIYLGGTDVAGGKLKDYFRSLWSSPNCCIANNYGFAALPGGMKHISNYKTEYRDIKDSGYWWTSTWKNDWIIYFASMGHSYTVLAIGEYSKRYGYNVRCIKD
jgi:uncharacterized protein (TIGR02145 family)